MTALVWYCQRGTFSVDSLHSHQLMTEAMRRAAPALLEALRAILADADRALAGDSNDAEHDALFDAAGAARDVIKLAGGER